MEKEGLFPSPTGVNYYEYLCDLLQVLDDEILSFRPQQGLTITNNVKPTTFNYLRCISFRPQQGLTITNQKW